MGEPVSIVIVDDHPIFRAGLVQTLLDEPGFRVVGQGASAREAIDLVRDLTPDVLLLDASMEDSGLDRIGDIVAVHPSVRIIILTASKDDDDVARALEAGVFGYVLKGLTARELVNVVHSVRAGQSYISPGAMGGLRAVLKTGTGNAAGEAQHPALSTQESHVLRLVARGLSNKEIGAQLKVTEKTVKFHLSNVFAKLHVRNRVEATLRARQIWADPAN